MTTSSRTQAPHSFPQPARTSSKTAVGANIHREQTNQTLRKRRKVSGSTRRVLDRARSIFPVKTAHYLHLLTGYPVRTCEHWLAKGRMPDAAMWALLQSEHGIRFLVAGMEGARPAWWSRLARVGLLTNVLRRRAADLRLFKDVVEADRDLTDAIARAETAAAFQDEKLHRPYVDALREMGGLSDSAVAGEAT